MYEVRTSDGKLYFEINDDILSKIMMQGVGIRTERNVNSGKFVVYEITTVQSFRVSVGTNALLWFRKGDYIKLYKLM